MDDGAIDRTTDEWMDNKSLRNTSIEESLEDCKKKISREREYMQQNNKMHQPVTAVIYSKSRRH